MNRRIFAAIASALIVALGVGGSGTMAFAATAATDGAAAQAAPYPAPAPAAPSPSAPSSSAPALTLAMAVKTALADNPQVAAAQSAVAAATQNIAVARTGLLPSVSFQGTGGEGTATTTINGVNVALPSPQMTASAGMVGALPIYDAGKTAAQVALAQATLSSDQAALKQTEQTIELQTATAFFNVLSAEQQTTVEQAALKQAQDNLALTQAQVKAGVAPQSDVIQAQAQVAQAEVNLLNAQSQIATNKSALQALLGADVTSDVTLQEPPAPPAQVAVASGQAIQQALVNRAEIATAQAGLQNAQAGVQEAQVQAGPQINVALTAGYTPYNTISGVNTNLGAASYGLTGTVDLPLFDSGKGKALVASAQATLRQAQAQLSSAQLTVRQSVYQAYLTAVQDAASVTATRAAAQAADQALAVAQGQYRAGVTTFLTVTTAQTTAATADVAAVTALYAYQSALAALQNAQGLSILSSTPGGAS